MDLRKLKTLIDLVSESNISELEITEADGKVRIVKADPAAPVHGLRPRANAGRDGSGGACRCSRSGRRRSRTGPHRQVTDGRDVLPLGKSGLQAVRRDR